MKLISIDVGTRNLAYCITRVEGGGGSLVFSENSGAKICIEDWNVIDLTQQPVIPCCSMPVGRPTDERLCGKKSAFFKNTEYFCCVHAKKQKTWLPAMKIPKSLTSKSKSDLKMVGEKLSILFRDDVSKSQMIETIETHTKMMLQPVVKPRGQCTFLDMGYHLRDAFVNVAGLDEITHVNIEEQMTSKMRTLQHMIAQFFITQLPHAVVDFVPASQKLKWLQIENKEMGHRNNKNYALQYGGQWLQSCGTDEWKTFVIKHQKQDDLYDALLHALGYYHVMGVSFEKARAEETASFPTLPVVKKAIRRCGK
jgi:hypothetical protein